MDASSSSRRTWIEIRPACSKTQPRSVVLLAEDVDRNIDCYAKSIGYFVVLLAEDVDRNDYKSAVKVAVDTSSSSRRTWIEISDSSSGVRRKNVVLLAEDVDRNTVTMVFAAPTGAVVLLAEDVDRNCLLHML